MNTIDLRSSHVENSTFEGQKMLTTRLEYRVGSTDMLNYGQEQVVCGIPSDLSAVSSYESLSSLSCDSERCPAEQECGSGEASVTSKPRSLFKTYWDKSGSTPQRSATPTEKSMSSHFTASTSPDSLCESSSDEESSAAFSYERILKRNEFGKSKRRSIFGKQESTPNLLARPYDPSPLDGTRKAKSLPELERNLSSCLRTGEQQRQRTQSVSFDTKVNVITFNQPQENWAADGWSKWFH